MTDLVGESPATIERHQTWLTDRIYSADGAHVREVITLPGHADWNPG